MPKIPLDISLQFAQLFESNDNFLFLRRESLTGRIKHYYLRFLAWQLFLNVLPSTHQKYESSTIQFTQAGIESECHKFLITSKTQHATSNSAYEFKCNCYLVSTPSEELLHLIDYIWPAKLAQIRDQYETTKHALVIDPSNISTFSDEDLLLDNPLSTSSQSSWAKYFANSEILSDITRDVTRTYPEMAFFRQKNIQEMMVRILLVYARIDSNIGYKQGMHELLATLIYVIYKERIENRQNIDHWMNSLLKKSNDLVPPSYIDNPHDINNVEDDPVSNEDKVSMRNIKCHFHSEKKMLKRFETIKTLFNVNYIEHDLFSLFQKVMQHVRAWYRPGLIASFQSNEYMPPSQAFDDLSNEQDKFDYYPSQHDTFHMRYKHASKPNIKAKGLKGRGDANFQKQQFSIHHVSSSQGIIHEPMTMTNHHHLNRPNTPHTLQIYHCIIQKSHYIQHVLLRIHDQVLSNHLSTLGIEPQLYLIRWIRLLFTREFLLEDTLLLWDAMMAHDFQFEMVNYLAVAMITLIRSKLLSGDYSQCIQQLQNYPLVEDILILIHYAIMLTQHVSNPSLTPFDT